MNASQTLLRKLDGSPEKRIIRLLTTTLPSRSSIAKIVKAKRVGTSDIIQVCGALERV
jgi:hypothetical protein